MLREHGKQTATFAQATKLMAYGNTDEESLASNAAEPIAICTSLSPGTVEALLDTASLQSDGVIVGVVVQVGEDHQDTEAEQQQRQDA